jgi:single-stranded DNA-binding protein
MNYQRIILAGNATEKAKRLTSKKGDVTFTTFGVGVSGANDKATFFPVTVFGKHGKGIAEYITKGRGVLVEGRIEVGDNNRFNIVANRVVLGASPEKPAKRVKKTK